MTLRKIVSAVSTDALICNLLETPTLGSHIGAGAPGHVVIPTDWMSRVMAGQHVPGCNYAELFSDNSLFVTDVVQTAVAGLAHLAGVSDGNLASFQAKLAVNPVLVNMGGQSNCTGVDAYPNPPGPWGGDSRCTYFNNGFDQAFAPNPGTLIFGSELIIGPTLATAKGRPVWIAKAAVGATAIVDWLPPANKYWGWVKDVCWQTQIRNTVTTPVHFVFQHGEWDVSVGTTRAQYLTWLQQYAADVRASYPVGQSVRFYIVTVNDNIPYTAPAIAAIQGAQADFVSADANAQLINSFQSIVPGSAVGPVPIHYSADQVINVVGPAIASAIQANL